MCRHVGALLAARGLCTDAAHEQHNELILHHNQHENLGCCQLVWPNLSVAQTHIWQYKYPLAVDD